MRRCRRPDVAAPRQNRRSGLPRGAGEMKRSRLRILYSGRVQGVGFRYTARTVAHGFEITGTVRNLADGRVELIAEGGRAELEEFRKAVQDSEVGSFIRHEEVHWGEPSGGLTGFVIVG